MDENTRNYLNSCLTHVNGLHLTFDAEALYLKMLLYVGMVTPDSEGKYGPLDGPPTDDDFIRALCMKRKKYFSAFEELLLSGLVKVDKDNWIYVREFPLLPCDSEKSV